MLCISHHQQAGPVSAVGSMFRCVREFTGSILRSASCQLILVKCRALVTQMLVNCLGKPAQEMCD